MTDSTTEPTAESEATGDAPADKLEAALAKKKSENATFRLRAQGAEKERDDAVAELEKLRESTATDHEKATAKAVKEALKEQAAGFANTLLVERVRTVAATKANDPDDVIALLELEGLDVDDNAGIAAAVDALIEAKPYLSPDGSKKKTADIDQGANGQVEGDSGKEGDPNAWLRNTIAAKTGQG